MFERGFDSFSILEVGMRISKGMYVVIAVLCVAAQNAQSAEQQSAEELSAWKLSPDQHSAWQPSSDLPSADPHSTDQPSADQKSSEIKIQPIFIKSVLPPKVEATDKPSVLDADAASALEKLLTEAEALIQGAKPIEAYALLDPKDFEYSGNSRFDYLLGISALDSGHPDKATLAFERVLAVDPNFAGARLDMARAYFHLGDLARAKT